jgi:hypothetical protein
MSGIASTAGRVNQQSTPFSFCTFHFRLVFLSLQRGGHPDSQNEKPGDVYNMGIARCVCISKERMHALQVADSDRELLARSEGYSPGMPHKYMPTLNLDWFASEYVWLSIRL